MRRRAFGKEGHARCRVGLVRPGLEGRRVRASKGGYGLVREGLTDEVKRRLKAGRKDDGRSLDLRAVVE